MMGNSYKFVSTWQTEVGHEEKFLSRRGVQAGEQVAGKVVISLSLGIFIAWLAKPTANLIRGWKQSISAWVLGRLDKTTSRNTSCK